MPGHTVLVVGAGFSKPVGGPLLAELLSADVIKRSRASTPHLLALQQLAADPGIGRPYTLEELFTYIWRAKSTKQPLRIGGAPWDSSELYRQVEIHLADVCDRIRLDMRYNAARRYPTFLSLLQATSKSLTVLSFNYDMLVERTCDTLDLTYDYGAMSDLQIDDASRRRRLRSRGTDVCILKLHGSANWGVCWGCRKAEKKNAVILAHEDVYVPVRRKACPFCGDHYMETGIVPPILVKGGEVEHLDEAWVQARKALRRAATVVSVGYSLPAGDSEALMLLAEARTSNLKEARVICGPSGAPETYQQLFGPKLTDERAYFQDYLAQLETDLFSNG